MIVSGLVCRMRWFVLAAAEITAAATTAAAVTPGYDTANQEECLACWRCDHEVCIYILFAELFSNVQPKGTVVVVDIPLSQITKDGMGSIYLFELFCCLGIVGVLVGVIFEGEFPVCLLYIVGCGGLLQT